MKAQLALGRSWPLASHLPGAPASGLTEKMCPCVHPVIHAVRPFAKRVGRAWFPSRMPPQFQKPWLLWRCHWRERTGSDNGNGGLAISNARIGETRKRYKRRTGNRKTIRRKIPKWLLKGNLSIPLRLSLTDSKTKGFDHLWPTNLMPFRGLNLGVLSFQTWQARHPAGELQVCGVEILSQAIGRWDRWRKSGSPACWQLDFQEKSNKNLGFCLQAVLQETVSMAGPVSPFEPFPGAYSIHGWQRTWRWDIANLQENLTKWRCECQYHQSWNALPC